MEKPNTPKHSILPVIVILPSGSCRRGYWDPSEDTFKPLSASSSDDQQWFDKWTEGKHKNKENLDCCQSNESLSPQKSQTKKNPKKIQPQ